MNASVQDPRAPETAGSEGCIGAEERERLRKRLRRIEGQVRGVQRMVGEDTPCVDILTQLGATVAATEKVALLVLTGHAGRCIRESVEGAEDAEVTVGEISRAVERFLRV
jgi:CsoR family transcriptional regulator, copper-sensing transcriptional repressor